MKKYLLLIVFLANSVLGQFIPVPMKESAPWRLFVGTHESTIWDPATITYLGGHASAIYALGKGFDVGANLQGGITNNAGLFKNGNATQGVLAIDLMLRYLIPVTDFFFVGTQVKAGYYQNLSSSPVVPNGTEIPIEGGMVFGFPFANKYNLYLFPAIELGNKGVSDVGNVWGSLVGINMAVGFTVDLGRTMLVLEVKPRIKDLCSICAGGPIWSTVFLAGLAWDI